MRHHFTTSEQLAIEAWFWLGKRGLIPSSIHCGFDDMDSQVIYEGEWSAEDSWGTSERVVARAITFHSKGVFTGQLAQLVIFLGGHEIKHSPVMTKEPSRTHWWLERVELGTIRNGEDPQKGIAFKERAIPQSCEELRYLMRTTCLIDRTLKAQISQ